MNIAFLYPNDPFNHRQVDENYKEEYNLAKEKGLKTYLIDIENIAQSNIIPTIPSNMRLIYRGWMLNEITYTQLEKRFGLQLVTSKKDYFNAHYLPNWYENIQYLTIPSVVTNEQNAQKEFIKFPGKAFIKDYVKSLKTGKGSIVDSPEDIMRAITDMKHYRGYIEGGIILRNFIDLEQNSETRFFVIHNNIFSPTNDVDKYSLVEDVVSNLRIKDIKFYSVDVATIKNGKNIVIEIGDGQVSDYVGWSIKDFVAILSSFEKIE